MCRHILVTPLLHLTLLEKGTIEIRNGNICVRHILSDLLKATPRDDVVEADGGAFLGGNEILQKGESDRVDKIKSHNQTTTNHKKYSLNFIAELRRLLVSGMNRVEFIITDMSL